MSNAWITLQQVLILVIEIGIGYLAAKRGKITASALGVMTYMCCNIALPCAIINAIINLDNSPEVWKSLSTGVAVILACTLAQILVCLFLFRKAEKPKRAVYQMATVYGNSAYMGIPLVTAILGGEALIYVTLMVIFDTVFLFSHASMAMSGSKPTVGFVIKKIFGLATVSLIIGLVILVTGIKLPAIAITCMNDMRGMLTPVAMLVVGSQLAQQDIRKIFQVPAYYGVAAWKLVVWPLVISVCLLPFKGMMPAMAIVSIVICKATSQPAVLGVMASDNGLDGEAAAGIVGLNTILSILTLPVIVGIAQALFM